jgi:hypothetical protein
MGVIRIMEVNEFFDEYRIGGVIELILLDLISPFPIASATTKTVPKHISAKAIFIKPLCIYL